MTKRQQYLQLCLQCDRDWLRACVADPSPYMTPMHIKLALIALRRRRA